MSKTKKPQAVADAEAALESKWAEIAAACEVVKRLESEHSDACGALVKARLEADATLPQCRIVRVRRYSGEDVGSESSVIVRRTPGGLLVVRRAGEPSGHEYKFKWAAYAGVYRQTEKKTSYAADRRELRDVPPEYLPEPPR